MMYLDQCGNVMRDVIKLLEETNDEQRFDFRESTTKENHFGITGETHPTGLEFFGSARESNDGRVEE